MPKPAGSDTSQHTAHINALLAACSAPPSSGGVVIEVDHPDNASYISPPIVIGPLYQCATQVAVRGSILNAKVELFINGIAVGTLIARNPHLEEFNVPDLVAGDVVTATQEFNGTLSVSSAPVTVGDITVDYPSGLPAPEIDPTLIYQCAETIAVRHVPGVKITVFTNGGNPVTRSTSTDWSVVHPSGSPFNVGDSFTAEAALCDATSPSSILQSAVPAPATVPTPTFNPATVYAGQELITVETLVNGSYTSIAEDIFGPLGEFTTPVSWYSDFDVATPLGQPLAGGEKLIASQTLCDLSSKSETLPVMPCEALPAPRIQTPLVGNNYVVVNESVPGARIRVYDNGGNELGDGSGTVIMLSRFLTGTDTITVVQQLGECTSRTGYRVSVHNPNSSDDN